MYFGGVLDLYTDIYDAEMDFLEYLEIKFDYENLIKRSATWYNVYNNSDLNPQDILDKAISYQRDAEKIVEKNEDFLKYLHREAKTLND